MPEEDNGASGAAPLDVALGARTRTRWAPVPAAPPRPPGLTRFVYPGAVPVQLPLNLLLAPQLHESSPVLHSLSLFGKFPVDGEETGHQVQVAP